MMKKNISFLLVLLCFSTVLFSQEFTNINAGLLGTHWGDVAWGDYDADGDLDVVITGLDANDAARTKIYKNNGSDVFTEITTLSIPGTSVGDVSWGDIDADGDLDLLVLGYTNSSQITKIYKNGGDDNFGDSGISFPDLADGSSCFVDYNNDGFLDIMISGYDNEIYRTVVYKNDGNGIFNETNIDLPGTIKSSYEWADYDNDGDMDVFILGLDFNGTLISKLYRNNGDETFTETSDHFTGAWLGDMEWGDYDNDGDLDVLLSGYTFSTERVVKLYKNKGDGSFIEILSTGLTGVSHSSAIWGDYDNDGDLDVFIGGTYETDSGWNRVTDVFINNGDDTFSAAGFSFSADVFWGESAWGDYDNDGDLDLICCGFDDGGGSNTIIYRNEISTSNTAPSSPTNLSAEVIDNKVILSWDAANDNETPSAGLSYNAYIKNEEGMIVWNSLAITESGFKLIPGLGNAGQNTSWEIKNLDLGDYTWSVQAIDHHFEGSMFSEEEPFSILTVGIANPSLSEQSLLIYPNPASNYISFNLAESSSESSLLITDVYGKIIEEIPINMKTKIVWNCSEIPAGIYFYQTKIEGIAFKGKVLVE